MALTKLERDLAKLAELFTPRIRKAFLAAIADVRNRAVLTAITEAIRQGDLEAAFKATGLTPAAMRPITAMIEQAFEQGGVTVAGTFPKGLTDGVGQSVVFRFDVRNSRAEAWARDHSSTLVTRVTDEARTVIRQTIEQGVEDGRNPRAVALDIVGRIDTTTGRRTGGTIGLTAQMERWVAGARRQLIGLDPAYLTRKQRDGRFDSIVRKAIDSGKPLDPAKIDALIGRYSDRLLQLRGETIARTEMIQSLNMSADLAFRQAIEEGTVSAKLITKTWDATGDDRTRHTHLIMDGQRVSFDEPFTTPWGARLMFPGDISLGAPASEIINCRCRVKHNVDWFADLD